MTGMYSSFSVEITISNVFNQKKIQRKHSVSTFPLFIIFPFLYLSNTQPNQQPAVNENMGLLLAQLSCV